jgi:hypothetical protein
MASRLRRSPTCPSTIRTNPIVATPSASNRMLISVPSGRARRWLCASCAIDQRGREPNRSCSRRIIVPRVHPSLCSPIGVRARTRDADPRFRAGPDAPISKRGPRASYTRRLKSIPAVYQCWSVPPCRRGVGQRRLRNDKGLATAQAPGQFRWKRRANAPSDRGQLSVGQDEQALFTGGRFARHAAGRLGPGRRPIGRVVLGRWIGLARLFRCHRR